MFNLSEDNEDYRSQILHDALSRHRCEKTPRPIISVTPQLWGSSALGFGGIGACVMTTALTATVKIGSTTYVYFDKDYAYEVDQKELSEDQKKQLVKVKKSGDWPDVVNIDGIGAKRLV